MARYGEILAMLLCFFANGTIAACAKYVRIALVWVSCGVLAYGSLASALDVKDASSVDNDVPVKLRLDTRFRYAHIS
jgi:hypothetical protein